MESRSFPIISDVVLLRRLPAAGGGKELVGLYKNRKLKGARGIAIPVSNIGDRKRWGWEWRRENPNLNKNYEKRKRNDQGRRRERDDSEVKVWMSLLLTHWELSALGLWGLRMRPWISVCLEKYPPFHEDDDDLGRNWLSFLCLLSSSDKLSS